SEPGRVSGGKGELGHMDELREDPISLFWRVREECGELGVFKIADRDICLASGAAANEAFFRAPDESLDQAAAYPFMTPVFGEGVVFDASPERRSEMLHNTALRGEHMRGHAVTIPHEVQRMVDDWGDEGEIDLLEWFSELTIYTSSACLIGPSSASSWTSASRTSTTTSSRAPTRTPTSTPTPTSPPSVSATRHARAWSSWSRGSWTRGSPTRPRTRRTATSWTCWCRSRTTTAACGSRRTRSPASSSR